MMNAQIGEESKKGMAHNDSMLSLATAADSQESYLSSLNCADCDARGNDQHSTMAVKTQAESVKPEKIVHTILPVPPIRDEFPTEIVEQHSEDIISMGPYLALSTTSEVPQKCVSFDTVEVREHAYILGCNPGTTAGPPLSISWEALSTSIMSLDAYEAIREPERLTSSFLLMKSKTERVNMLLRLGFDHQEIHLAEAYADDIRRSREESARETSDLKALMIEAGQRKKESIRAKKTAGSGNPLRRLFRRQRIQRGALPNASWAVAG